MDIREAMIKALRKRYEAVIEEAKATAEVYLLRPVGIGEHPQFIEELDKLIEQNDILFIFPHQIKYFNNEFFDISIAIDCLHEMDKKIIKKYMDLFNLKSKYLYYKVWEETYVPHCFNNYLNANSRKDYFIKPSWKQVLCKRSICPSNFMELAYKIKS